MYVPVWGERRKAEGKAEVKDRKEGRIKEVSEDEHNQAAEHEEAIRGFQRHIQNLGGSGRCQQGRKWPRSSNVGTQTLVRRPTRRSVGREVATRRDGDGPSLRRARDVAVGANFARILLNFNTRVGL